MRRLPALALILLLAGCAQQARATQYGILNGLMGRQYLVTLYVYRNVESVAQACPTKADVPKGLGMYGCQWNNEAVLSDGTKVQRTTVVRLTDRVPSATALEIEAHELCHVVASLQPMDDPCHLVNGGVIGANR